MLSKLRLFVEIASVGNVSLAAKRFFTSQSSASTQLKIMEKQIGVPLFDRVGRGIRLNEDGEIFLKFAQEALQQFDEAMRSIQERQKKKAYNFVICAGNYFNIHYLPQILPLFTAEHDDLTIDIVTKFSDEIIEDIEKKVYEFGIVGTSCAIRSPHIQTDFSYTTQLLFVCSPQNPLAEKNSLSPADIKHEVFMCNRPNSNYRLYVQHKLRKHHFRFASEISHTSVDAIKAAVSGNLGVTILPRHAVQRELDAGQLAYIPLENINLTRIFCCIHNTERPLSAEAKHFISLCIEVLNTQENLSNNIPAS